MMSNENAAVFIGHSECYGITSEMVTAEIIKLIDKGVIYFLSGGQGGFDRLCAGCVHRLKKQYPQIQNILVIPYLTFNVFDKDIFDEIVYPPNTYGNSVNYIRTEVLIWLTSAIN